MKLFSTALFAPIQYFAHLTTEDQALIEINCHYARRTYRNRYVILGANGPITLSVPVEKIHRQKVPTHDVTIAYDTPWQDLHWKSIVSAYNSSPYFLYYRDDFEPLFQKPWKYLIDLNRAATEICLRCLDIDTTLDYTKQYYSPHEDDLDLRDFVHPQKELSSDAGFQPAAYRQVLNTDGDFIPNLSILDLIFNKGPESILILKASLKNAL
jgi:hypothetical protein